MLGVITSLGRISRRLGNRGSLTAKRGNKNYYKGTGGRKEGKNDLYGECVRCLRCPLLCCAAVQRLTSAPAGNYILDKVKMLEIVAPDLKGFDVRFCLGRRCGVVVSRLVSRLMLFVYLS